MRKLWAKWGHQDYKQPLKTLDLLLNACKHLSLIYFILLTHSGISQSVVFQGTVLDSNYQPIPLASIKFLKKDSSGVVKYYTISKPDGTFFLHIDTLWEPLWLQVSAVGFENLNEAFTLKAWRNKSIVLKPHNNQLPSINVKASLPITKKGDTTSYKVSAFEKGNENSLADLLGKLPGLSVDKLGRISFNGKAVSRILLEDDDLTGSNYETLTNNLTRTGLETIDVIENYKDNGRLENKFNIGNETVLNLKYKKQSIRVFGNVGISAGLPIKFYEAKNSSIGILARQKFIVNVNSNTNGQLATALTGNANDSYVINHDNNSMSANFTLPVAPVQFHNIQPNNLSNARVFANTSNLAAANYLFKPTKKLQLKTVGNYLSDVFTQQNTSIEVINNPLTPLTLEQNNNTKKNNRLINTFTEIAWSPTTTSQTIVQFSHNNSPIFQRRTGFVFSDLIYQQISQNLVQNQLNLTSTKLIGTKALLTWQAYSSTHTLNNTYQIINPVLDSNILIQGNFNILLQPFSQRVSYLGTHLKYSYKMRNTTITVQLGTSSEKNNSLNETILFSNPDSVTRVSNSFLNSGSLNILKQNVTILSNTKFSEQLSVAAGVQFLQSNLLYQNNINPLSLRYKRSFILPTFNAHYHIDKKQSLLLGFQLQPVLPNLKQLNPSNYFTGVTSITQGIEQLIISNGYSINAGYLLFDIFKKGIVFNIFLLHTNLPQIYANNISVSGLYSLQNAFVFNKNNDFSSLAIKLEKQVPSMRAWFTVGASVNTFSSFTLVNRSPVENRSSGIQVNTKVRTEWKKWFNINTSLIGIKQIQKSMANMPNTNYFSSIDFLVQNTLSIQPRPKLFLDVQLDYIVNKPSTTFSRSATFIDLTLRYNATKKINAGFTVRNALNQRTINTFDIDPVQANSNNFNLLPRFGMITVNVRY